MSANDTATDTAQRKLQANHVIHEYLRMPQNAIGEAIIRKLLMLHPSPMLWQPHSVFNRQKHQRPKARNFVDMMNSFLESGTRSGLKVHHKDLILVPSVSQQIKIKHLILWILQTP